MKVFGLWAFEQPGDWRLCSRCQTYKNSDMFSSWKRVTCISLLGRQELSWNPMNLLLRTQQCTVEYGVFCTMHTHTLSHCNIPSISKALNGGLQTDKRNYNHKRELVVSSFWKLLVVCSFILVSSCNGPRSVTYMQSVSLPIHYMLYNPRMDGRAGSYASPQDREGKGGTRSILKRQKKTNPLIHNCNTLKMLHLPWDKFILWPPISIWQVIHTDAVSNTGVTWIKEWASFFKGQC